MRVFWKVVVTGIQQQLAYRGAMWAGLATNLFFGLLRAAVMMALYQGQEVVNGLSIEGAITFVSLTQAMIAFTTIFGSFDIIKLVYSGDISSDLLKPMDFYRYWMARDLGASLVNLIGRGLLFMGLFAIFYRVLIPRGFLDWAAFGVTLALSWLISYSWRFLVNLSAFWTPDAVGIGRGVYGFAQILSGFFVPLRLLPDWFNHICQFSPFPAMINTPVEVYLGMIRDNDYLYAVGMQVMWLLVLVIAGRLVYRAGVRRLVLQGG